MQGRGLKGHNDLSIGLGSGPSDIRTRVYRNKGSPRKEMLPSSLHRNHGAGIDGNGNEETA